MTASAGLHNLPAELRPAVAAEPGHVLVRADLGQVEPRVLAAVSGDPALARATADDDLYAPVAAAARRSTGRPPRSPCWPRCTARPPAPPARRCAGWSGPTRSRWATCARRTSPAPQARDVRTYGGRGSGCGRCRAGRPAAAAARARFARNAVVQGAAAELFKMWAVSVRAGLPPGAEVVLCLHDELLRAGAEADAAAVVDAAARRAHRDGGAVGGRQRRAVRRRRAGGAPLVGGQGLTGRSFGRHSGAKRAACSPSTPSPAWSPPAASTG